MDEFTDNIQAFDKAKDLPYLYAMASTWTSYIQLTSNDFNSIAQLGRVELMMQQVVAIDSAYEYGMALVYLGALNSLLPPALGGKPEVAKAYFERAIAASAGKNLISKVIYAQMYARLLFERELHDRLLKEVLAADSQASGLTLQNQYAKQQAALLLADADEYF